MPGRPGPNQRALHAAVAPHPVRCSRSLVPPRRGAADKGSTWCAYACDNNSTCSAENLGMPDARAAFAYSKCELTKPWRCVELCQGWHAVHGGWREQPGRALACSALTAVAAMPLAGVLGGLRCPTCYCTLAPCSAAGNKASPSVLAMWQAAPRAFDGNGTWCVLRAASYCRTLLRAHAGSSHGADRVLTPSCLFLFATGTTLSAWLLLAASQSILRGLIVTTAVSNTGRTAPP